MVGLTGGIGTGKSTVSAMLAERGAEIVDADVLAREVVEPGTEGFDQVVRAFGSGVVAADGSLDRPKLAAVVFNDPAKLKVLNDIIHPRVGQRVAERLAELADTGAIVVLDIPLLLESTEGSRRFAEKIVVVATDEPTQLERLAGRGVTLEDAKARIANQRPMAEKIELADHVIDNNGDLASLEQQVDELWAALTA